MITSFSCEWLIRKLPLILYIFIFESSLYVECKFQILELMKYGKRTGPGISKVLNI